MDHLFLNHPSQLLHSICTPSTYHDNALIPFSLLVLSRIRINRRILHNHQMIVFISYECLEDSFIAIILIIINFVLLDVFL